MMASVFKKLRTDWLVKKMKPLMGWYFRLSPRMITCREFNDLIFDHTEGLLTEKQTTRFERHIRACPICRNFLKTYTAAYKAGSTFLPYNDVEVPKTVPKELLDTIRDTTDTQNK